MQPFYLNWTFRGAGEGAWWYMPVTLALKGLRQENCHGFITILGYTASPCHEQSNSPNKILRKKSMREGTGLSMGLAV